MGPACLQPSNCLHEGHLSEIFGLRLGLGLASIYLQWAQGNVGHTASTNGCTADHDQLSWFRPFPTMWMCPHVAKILTRTANERIVTACASTYSHTLLQRCVSQDLQTHCSTISSDHSHYAASTSIHARRRTTYTIATELYCELLNKLFETLAILSNTKLTRANVSSSKTLRCSC